MSLFNDDFYSAKVSKRTVKRLGTRNYKSKSSLRKLLDKPIQLAIITSLSTALIVSLIFLFSMSSKSDTPVALDLSERSIVASEKVRASVVSIVSEQKYSLGLNSKLLAIDSTESGIYKDAGAGSGVIVKKDEQYAYIVTNSHVLTNAQRIRIVLTDGEERYAELVGQDSISDIAVVKIEADGIEEIAEIGDSSQLRSAEFVLAMGNPLGMGESTTLGIVSVKSEFIGVAVDQVGVIDWEQEVIRVDAAINQGNSGGPLIDMNGQVVGINSMKISDVGVESIGYAIPINNVMPIVEQLIDKGYVSRPYIGLYMKNLAEYFAQLALSKELEQMLAEEQGIEAEVDEESAYNLKLPNHILDGVIVYKAVGPAEEAGIQFNDVIVGLDHVEVKNILDLRKYLYTSKSIGDDLTIHFYRGEEKKSITIKLIENPNQ